MIVSYMEDHLEDGSDLSVLAPPIERDRLTALLEGRFSWVLTLFKVSATAFNYRMEYSSLLIPVDSRAATRM